MPDNRSSSSGGIGLGGAVFLVFLILKLLGKLTWSWWWVTAPLWGTWALLLAVLVIGGAIAGAARALESDEARKRRELRQSLDAYRRSLGVRR